MTSKIKIEETILSDNFFTRKSQEDFLEKTCHNNFPWYFNQKTADYSIYNNQVISKGFDEAIMFSHVLYNDLEPRSEHFYDLIKPFYFFCEKNNIYPRSIIRAKLNMTVRSDQELPTPAHVDFPFDHNVFIYYANESDGETIIYNKAYNQNDNFKLDDKDFEYISPKMGRGVVFNGKKYHSFYTPKNNDNRIVMNVVFV